MPALNKRVININSMVSIEVMDMDYTKRKATMSNDYANKLKRVAQDKGIIGFAEVPHFVSYLHNKRSFVLSTTNSKFYHIRAKFSNNFSWIYELHRRMGQSECCSRAHASGEGLPDDAMIRAHEHAYSVFTSASMVPCQRCFLQHKEDPYAYINTTIGRNKLGLTLEDITNRQIVTSRIMTDLISGSKPMCEELVGGERYLVSCSELRQMCRSIERSIFEVKELANRIINDTNDAAADEWVADAPLKGIVPRDLVTNNFCRSILGAIIKLEEAMSKLDVTKSSYDEIYNTQEYIVTIRRSLQSFEFSYNLTH